MNRVVSFEVRRVQYLRGEVVMLLRVLLRNHQEQIDFFISAQKTSFYESEPPVTQRDKVARNFLPI